MSGHASFQPQNKAVKWFEDRLPILGLAHSSFVVFPTPRNLNYWWTFGGILAFFLVVQLVTGITLAMHYVPHQDLAFNSVESIMRDVNYGWLIRYLHANGSAMFFLAVYIHIFRGIYYGSFRAPREILWIVGVLIFIAMMATGFLGYVLPWGQMSFWAATVITNLFSVIPVFGESIVQWLWGGFSVGQPTLNRFFALHYLVPFILVALVAIHVWALHVVGNNNPKGLDVKSEQDTLPFHPYYTIKDGFAIVAFTLIFFWFVFYNPNQMGHPDNYIPANPMVTPPHIVPEWYFLPFYAILRAIPDKLMGVVAMGASLLVLVILPWLDRSPARSLVYRPIMRQFFWIFVADALFLGWLGSQPASGIYVTLARLATAYYFLHFLVILPVISKLEKPRPRPDSIMQSVLDK